VYINVYIFVSLYMHIKYTKFIFFVKYKTHLIHYLLNTKVASYMPRP